MADSELIASLRRGATVWNQSRAARGSEPLDLCGADLPKSDLRGCDLRGVDLTGANLSQAFLTHARLEDSILVEADLRETVGLAVEALADADLQGAVLPRAIARFPTVERLNEAARASATIFLSLLLGCSYSLLTALNVSDEDLLVSASRTPLPIIDTAVDIQKFFQAAPFLLLAIASYLNLYLLRIFEDAATLPAVFPDGREKFRHIYPWLPLGLLSERVKSRVQRTGRRPQRSHPALHLRWLQSGLAIALLWWSVPATLLFLWLRFLTSHNWEVTYPNAIALTLSIWSAAWFQWLSRRTLLETRSDRRRLPCSSSTVFTSRPGSPRTVSAWLLISTISVASLFLVILTISYGAIEGYHRTGTLSPFDAVLGIRRTELATPVAWFEGPLVEDANGVDELLLAKLPLLFEWTGFVPVARLEAIPNPLKPPNLKEIKPKDLREVQLRHARAERAFLAKVVLDGADLRGAHLQDADLRLASLEGADLTSANLQAARLEDTTFNSAIIKRTNFNAANLKGARLNDAVALGANFSAAHLSEAILNRTDLTDATFKDADLCGADLSTAGGLSEESLRTARRYKLAWYSREWADKLGLCIAGCEENDNRFRARSRSNDPCFDGAHPESAPINSVLQRPSEFGFILVSSISLRPIIERSTEVAQASGSVRLSEEEDLERLLSNEWPAALQRKDVDWLATRLDLRGEDRRKLEEGLRNFQDYRVTVEMVARPEFSDKRDTATATVLREDSFRDARSGRRFNSRVKLDVELARRSDGTWHFELKQPGADSRK